MWNILGRLPSASHYVTATRNDPEYAEWVVSQPEVPDRKWHPPAAEWSTTEELLAAAVDRLGGIATLLSDMPTAVKKRSKPPSAFPRPVTAIEKARAAAEARVESDLDALIEAAHAEYKAEHEGG